MNNQNNEEKKTLETNPYIILGIPKSASDQVIDLAWAKKLKLAKRGKGNIPTKSLNTARDQLKDPQKRAKIDLEMPNICLEPELIDDFEKKIPEQAKLLLEVKDHEKSMQDYAPAVKLPKIAEVKNNVKFPEIEGSKVVLDMVLNQYVLEQPDPWMIAIGE